MASNENERMDAAEVSQLLEGGVLEGCPIQAVVAEGTGHDVLIIECEITEAFDFWREFRDLVDETRRWPVFVDNWFDMVNLEAQPLPDVELVFPFTNPDTLRSLSEQQRDLQWRGICLGLGIDPDSAEAPTLAEVKDELGEAVTVEAVSQWVLGLQLDRGQIDVEQLTEPYHSWSPVDGHHTALVLFPAETSWEALNYLYFYPCRDQGPFCAAMFRSWHERFGADVWAAGGVTLEMMVDRPPLDLETAWRLTFEQMAVAGLTGHTSRLNYAGSLIGRDRWLLYDRP